MEVDAYLKRIGYSGPREPTEDVLRELCWAHVTHVPFYTLDLFGSGERKTMKLEAIYDKIVKRNWGGMCYELNALFSWLLRELGFQVEVIKTEALAPNREYGGSLVKQHLTIIVSLPNGEKRVADVSSLALPLRLDTETPQDQRNTKARAKRCWCEREKAWYICIEKLERKPMDEDTPRESHSQPGIGGDQEKRTERQQQQQQWKGRFRFCPDSKNTELEDFQINLDATQDSEANEFRKISFCVLQTDSGMKALICNTYMEKEYIDDYTDVKRARVVRNQNEIREILKAKFNIELDYEPQLPDSKKSPF